MCDLRVSGRGATPIVVRPAEPARKVEGLAIRNCIANLYSLIDGRPNSRTARPMTCPCRGSKLSLGWQQGLNEGAAYPDFLPPREAPSSLLASSGSHQRLPRGPMSGSTESRQLGHAAWTTAAPGAREEAAIPHAPSRGRCVAWRALPRRRQPPGFSPLSNKKFYPITWRDLTVDPLAVSARSCNVREVDFCESVTVKTVLKKDEVAQNGGLKRVFSRKTLSRKIRKKPDPADAHTCVRRGA